MLNVGHLLYAHNFTKDFMYVILYNRFNNPGKVGSVSSFYGRKNWRLESSGNIFTQNCDQ